MSELASDGIDLIEELRLRRWARRNYVPAAGRAGEWHPIVLDEMRAKDREASPVQESCPPTPEHDWTEPERRSSGAAWPVSESCPLLPFARPADDPGRPDELSAELSANRRICALYVPLPPTHVSIVHPAHEVPAEPNLTRAVESATVEWLR